MQPLNLTHLVVDEVQDTDSIQYAWISLHTRAGVNTSIVGDDDQAIYSFRASGGVKIFQQFEKQFRPNIFYLNTCFRCEPEILKVAGALIEKMFTDTLKISVQLRAVGEKFISAHMLIWMSKFKAFSI